MLDKEPQRANLSTRSRLVRCGLCGRSEECSAPDLLRFTREGWPKCCGQVMAYFRETEPPGTDDTALDKPSLPPDPNEPPRTA